MIVQFTALENNKTVNTATASWLDISSMLPGGTIDVRGVGASDAIQLYVSNQPASPGGSAADPGQTLGSAITTAGITKLDSCYRWLKVVRTTAGGTPLPVSVYVFGIRGAAQ